MSTTMDTLAAADRRSRAGAAARLALVAVGLLLVAGGAFVLTVPVSADDFEAATGTSWVAFAEANPDVAAYLEREARLLAVGFIGFGLLAAAAAWVLPAARGMGAVGILALIPVTLGAVAAIFLSAGGVGLGGFYGVLALVAALAVAGVALRGGR